jgi:rhodanese-related sulfurtransferase
MAPRNLAGPSPVDLTPPRALTAEDLHARIAAGGWVIDLRDRIAYAADHLTGTVSIELGDHFSTYVGWLLPWQADLTLIGETATDIAAAQRQLVRIGRDAIDGATAGPLQQVAGGLERGSYPVTSFADPAFAPGSDLLDPHDTRRSVLDVRRDDEREHGRIPGSLHIPLQRILLDLDAIPDRELWVHCQGGFRAGIAASILARAGRAVVLVDDDFDRAISRGLARV